jgi:hypothetical protein
MTTPIISIVEYDIWDRTTRLVEVNQLGCEHDWAGIQERACEFYLHALRCDTTSDYAFFVTEHIPDSDAGFTVGSVNGDTVDGWTHINADSARDAVHSFLAALGRD